MKHKPIPEIADINAAIDKHERAQFEAERGLSALADERAALLVRPESTVEEFSALNRKRDELEFARGRAIATLPRLRGRLAELVDQEKKQLAAAYRERVAEALPKLDKAVTALLRANDEIFEIAEGARRDLRGPNFRYYSFPDIAFRGRPSPEAVAEWRAFVQRELGQRAAASPPPGRPTRATLKVPTPDAAGKLRILLFCRHSGFMPGDVASLPAKVAEKLVRLAAAEFAIETEASPK